MRSDKGEAFVMRRNGKSYREISQSLGVAKSTLSNWFAGVDFSKAVRSELVKQASKKGAVHFKKLNRVRGIALKVHYELAEKEAIKEMQLYRNVPLFTTGLAIYWGEGDRVSKHNIRVSNTSPEMLKVFVAFLVHFGGIELEKVSLAMYLYPDLNEESCRRYWSKQVGVKKFHKTQILPSRHEIKRLPYGTCGVVVTSAYVKKKILVWIDHLPEIVLNTVPKKKRGYG